MNSPNRPGNDFHQRPRDRFARGILFALVPAGTIIVAALVVGLIVSAVIS